MKKIACFFLTLCFVFSLTSCRKTAIEPIEKLDLYREEGYQSNFDYLIESSNVDGWGPEMFGVKIFTRTTYYHTSVDPNGEAYLYEDGYYQLEDSEQNFTSAQPLTYNEILVLVDDYFSFERPYTILSDCINGTYIFAIAGGPSSLEPEFDTGGYFIMIGEAKNKQELSLLFLVKQLNYDNVYVGFTEMKTFYSQNGKFRKWGGPETGSFPSY